MDCICNSRDRQAAQALSENTHAFGDHSPGIPSVWGHSFLNPRVHVAPHRLARDSLLDTILCQETTLISLVGRHNIWLTRHGDVGGEAVDVSAI